MKKITILGATGSIGQSTLDVLCQNKASFGVYALTANKNADLLFEQCMNVEPKYAVIGGEKNAQSLQKRLRESRCSTEVLFGERALEDVAKHSDVDIVMAAIVGAAGLSPTMAAVNAGKRVLLANKESLVMSGKLFTDAVEKHSAVLLPIDSEHNAIFQCLPERFESLRSAGVKKLLLTGSGGPFRVADPSLLENVTPDQACAHPNWVMGRKISVDSATMMNKGLEYIEACWLFGAKVDEVEVIVHPQSIVHSMVEFIDGSVLAQMGRPDMRTPIAHCLRWPERTPSGVASLDFTKLGELSFEAPDYNRFPCLRLAMDAAVVGADLPAVVNAANEVAVDLFLSERIKFTQIAPLISEILSNWDSSEPDSIEAVIDADTRARRYTTEAVGRL